jgi:hypothetical protein
MSQFQANLKKLPGISHLSALNLIDAEGIVVATIENKAGSQGSLSVYNHLGQTYGAITPDAARKGLELRLLEDQFLDLRGKYVDAADDQHVVGAAGDLVHAPHRTRSRRQQVCGSGRACGSG